jgi:hypothetical protein
MEVSIGLVRGDEPMCCIWRGWIVLIFSVVFR